MSQKKLEKAKKVRLQMTIDGKEAVAVEIDIRNVTDEMKKNEMARQMICKFGDLASQYIFS